MSIPLYRLYDFLHDVCNRDDLIIYGFFPHGSKKLENFNLYKDHIHTSWTAEMTAPVLIFHDQEPLDYNLYSPEKIKDTVDSYHGDYYKSQNVKNLIAKLNLRGCTQKPLSVYDQVLLCHSETHSNDLNLYQQNGFIGVYCWSHALIARDWFRFAKLDPTLIPNFDNIMHDFLIYNRAWSGTREYRLTLAEMLADNDLSSCCNTSFAEFDQQSHYTTHKFTNPNLAINRDDLHKIYKANTHDSNASADYNAQDYNNTAIEVVLETLFDDSRHHLTEKTLRSIACGRPFILASTAGSLQYLKHYGFQTFNGLIDESYDLVEDPRMRLTAIVQEMQRIHNLDHNEKRSLWTELYKIAEQNKKIFLSDWWQDNIVKEFKQNFNHAMSKMTATGKYQKEMEKLALTDPAVAHLRSTNSNMPGGPTLECREKLSQWLKAKNSFI